MKQAQFVYRYLEDLQGMGGGEGGGEPAVGGGGADGGEAAEGGGGAAGGKAYKVPAKFKNTCAQALFVGAACVFLNVCFHFKSCPRISPLTLGVSILFPGHRLLIAQNLAQVIV